MPPLLSAHEATSLGDIMDIVRADVDMHGCKMMKRLATKHPAFYEKHYGHFAGNDETLTEQGRFTLNAICDITDDLKNGIYTTGIDKIDNAFFGHSHFYSTCGHGDEGRVRDPVDYKLAVENLVDYMSQGVAFGDKCNKDVKRVFQVVLYANGDMRKKTDFSAIEAKYKVYVEEEPDRRRR